MNKIKSFIISLSNFMLAVLYVIGGAVIIAPSNTIIPAYMGALSIGTLLLMIGLLGSPYCVDRWKE